MSRALAIVRRIAEIRRIAGADAIECAVVGGWTVVVKRDEFQAGEAAVYCEIDSWVPSKLAPFLSKGREPRVYNGVPGERLKTVKLRGQLSQGLLLPLTELNGMPASEGDDVTAVLNVQKWEPPVPTELAGLVRGPFPPLVPKTDQARIQNCIALLDSWRELTFELTEKLDGSSCTFYLDPDGEFHVCSRNVDLQRDEGNGFWRAALALGVEEHMRKHGLLGVALQGELVGEGICGNRYAIKGQQFYLFDVYEVAAGEYMSSQGRVRLAEQLGLKHAPVIDPCTVLPAGTDTVRQLLQLAEGKSVLAAKVQREGLVFKCVERPSVSFKAISNQFLLSGGH